VVDEARELDPRRAVSALGVGAELELAEARRERVVVDELAHERLAEADDDLQGLDRLEDADDAREHSEDARLGARGRELGRRRRRVEAAIARPLPGPEDGELPLEAV